MKYIIISLFLLCTFSLYATSVFDDALFWFRGGKDSITVNGQLDRGEFFDEIHANDLNHNNHKLRPYGYAENMTFRNERVVFPALDPSQAKEMQVLHVQDIPRIGENGTVNRYGAFVRASSIFLDNNISNEYTIIFRLRRDAAVNPNKLNRPQWFAKIGAANGDYGVQIGVHGDEAGTNKHLFVYYMNPSGIWTFKRFESERFYIPTNTWFDLSMTVAIDKIRVALALPDTISAVNGEKTVYPINFAEIAIHPDLYPVVNAKYYAFFSEKEDEDTNVDESTYDRASFLGSVQQIAIWKRALTDNEVMEAFGMPRPSIFRVGLDNNASNEFKSERTSSSQIVDANGSWRETSNEMQKGDTIKFNFTVSEGEGGLTQMFFIKTLNAPQSALMRVAINGNNLDSKAVGADARVYWAVPGKYIQSGANELTLTRIDNVDEPLFIDSFEMEGSFQVGVKDNKMTELVRETSYKYGYASSAFSNPKHWTRAISTHSSGSKFVSNIWVDSEVQRLCSSRIIVRITASSMKNQERCTFYVNGVEKAVRDNNTSGYEDITINFKPGELNVGWNELKMVGTEENTGYWGIDYYRFEVDEPNMPTLIFVR
jgi:hypothetical protein